MIEKGELIEWRDERGFGFVQTDKGERLFVHIKAFGPISRRPQVGDRLTFRFARGRGNDLVVGDARIVGLPPPSRSPRPRQPAVPSADRIEAAQLSRALRIAGAAILLAALFYVRSTGALPDWVLGLYLVMSIASFVVYWFDKRAANSDGWRVSEARLHTLDLFGGIIGGLLAQALFRHKTAKQSFATVTSSIYILHVAGLILLLAGVPALLLEAT